MAKMVQNKIVPNLNRSFILNKNAIQKLNVSTSTEKLKPEENLKKIEQIAKEEVHQDQNDDSSGSSSQSSISSSTLSYFSYLNLFNDALGQNEHFTIRQVHRPQKRQFLDLDPGNYNTSVVICDPNGHICILVTWTSGIWNHNQDQTTERLIKAPNITFKDRSGQILFRGEDDNFAVTVYAGKETIGTVTASNNTKMCLNINFTGADENDVTLFQVKVMSTSGCYFDPKELDIVSEKGFSIGKMKFGPSIESPNDNKILLPSTKSLSVDVPLFLDTEVKALLLFAACFVHLTYFWDVGNCICCGYGTVGSCKRLFSFVLFILITIFILVPSTVVLVHFI